MVPPPDAEISVGGKWSIAGIVEHLDLSYTLNIQGLEHRLRKGPGAVRKRTLRQHVTRLIITRGGYFPTGVSSPQAAVPKGRPFVELGIVIEPHLMLLDQRLKDVARAFGQNRPVLNHPILGPFSVADWRRFHWVHTRHHLRQIRNKSEVRRQKAEDR